MWLFWKRSIFLRYLSLLEAHQRSMRKFLQSIVGELHFFDHINAAVYDELVHMSCFLTKSSNSIAAGFRCPKLILEHRIVPRTNDCEVVRHVVNSNLGDRL